MLRKITDNQLRERIQKWLSPPDSSINHNVVCEAHHDGTAAWFLEGLIYNEWKATGSLLWTHGNRTVSVFSPTPPLMVSNLTAGSGKSVLWWVTPRPTFIDIAHIGVQFFNHKGH
jgi:hypothetical protein